MERDLVQAVDGIVAVSANLVERMSAMGRSAHLLTHGVDLEHWSTPTQGPPSPLTGLPEPRAVFWGVVDRRLDSSWLAALSRCTDLGSIALVGPHNEPEEGLLELPRIHPMGAVPYDELPSIAAEASVLIMPYADLPVTRAMQPLKLKEYLATGKPVVTSALPAVLEWQGACDVARSASEFAELVALRMGRGLPAGQRSERGRLKAEGWAEKARVFRRYLLGVDAE
jgi:glycosyltransferase involved in cell wall biosynthesis